jgi:hypothetical protein
MGLGVNFLTYLVIQATSSLTMKVMNNWRSGDSSVPRFHSYQRPLLYSYSYATYMELRTNMVHLLTICTSYSWIV